MYTTTWTSRAITTPPIGGGATKVASGVAQTIAVPTTPTNKGASRATPHTLRPARCSPSDFQPALEYPSWVITSSMINVATAGTNM